MKLLLLLLFILFILFNHSNNDELLVIRNALSPSQLAALRARLPRDHLYSTKNTDAHVGQSGRKSVPVEISSLTLGNHSVHPAIPSEYRVYYTGSHGMDWHRDQRVLTGSDYYECVLTVFNDSDSVFEYKDRWGMTRTIRPTANTLVMLRPEGVKHRVTPVTRGNREILKFVVVPTSMVTDVHNDIVIV